MGAMAELHLDCWRAQHEPVPILKLNRQAYAVAKLVGHCEALVGSGHLTEPSEQSLRLLIAETLSAFNMVPHDQLENEVAAVRQCMERTS
jgi:hypothetical protein